MSRPSRGAWIEIKQGKDYDFTTLSRAPRGARGLKSLVYSNLPSQFLSRPSRGAWIEIKGVDFDPVKTQVAPLAGRVD